MSKPTIADNRTIAAYLKLFINKQENIAGLWDGKTSGASEDAAHSASDLMELAQPFLDKLNELIADEDFVPPAK